MMPITKEFTIRLEDGAGTLGKLCQALAEQNNNILAYDPSPDRPVDRPATAQRISVPAVPALPAARSRRDFRPGLPKTAARHGNRRGAIDSAFTWQRAYIERGIGSIRRRVSRPGDRLQ